MRRWQSALRRLPAGVTSSEVSLQVKIASLEVKLGSLKVMTAAHLHLLMLCRNPSRSAVVRSQQLRRTVMTRPGVITSSFQVGKPLRRTKHIQPAHTWAPFLVAAGCCTCRSQNAQARTVKIPCLPLLWCRSRQHPFQGSASYGQTSTEPQGSLVQPILQQHPERLKNAVPDNQRDTFHFPWYRHWWVGSRANKHLVPW